MRFGTKLLASTALLAVVACGGQSSNSSASGISGEVLVDGSSTVAPLAGAAGELFKEQNPDVNVSVATSGTGGGFKKFCAGETDIATASRPIKDEEKATCATAGIEFAEVVVANDALTVVVNAENNWASCLTVAELKKMWEPAAEGKVTNWSQIRAGFANVPLDLYGPGTDSGTFDYFTKAINGEEGASRTDYQPSEDDNVTVTGVEGSRGGLGYLGFSYFEENAKNLKAVQINGGSGCVAPSSEDAQSGKYTPLSRPLFIYVKNKSYAGNPAVKAFVDYFVENDETITADALFVPLSQSQEAMAKDALAKLEQ